MAKLYNLARMTVSGTPGTGTITLLAAVAGHLTFAQAGVSTGETVAYGIEDGSNSECGTGVYTTAGLTLTRSVVNSTNSNALVSLTSAAQVYITALKADIANLREDQAFTGINTFSGKIQFPDATGIYDNSGNEQLLFGKTASAVNYLRIDNTVSGDSPSITATGDDTDVDGQLGVKGSGSWFFSSCTALSEWNTDSETVGFWARNLSATSNSQMNIIIGSGTDAQFQLAARHPDGTCTVYCSTGDLLLTVAETGKILRIENSGSPGYYKVDNLLQGFKALGSSHVNGTVTGTKVTDLTFTVGGGQYQITYYLKVQSSLATTGIGTGINATGGLNGMCAIRREATTGTTQALGVIDDVSNTGTGQLYEARAATALSTTSPNMLNTGGFATTNADCLVIIEVIIDCNSGDIELWHSSETANNTQISAGSCAVLRQIV